jgi:hypothetical protein
MQDTGPVKATTGAETTESTEVQKGYDEWAKMRGSYTKANRSVVDDYLKRAGGNEEEAARLYATRRVTPKAATSGNAAPASKPNAAPISKLQTPEEYAKQTNADPNISKEAKASMIARYQSGYPSALADEKAKAKPATAPTTGKVMTQADIAATAKASGKTIDEVKAQAKLKGYTIQ